MGGHLRFSIEESVWFQKGQEIDEILSISLEPDIVIDEYGDYVSIKGTLQLIGEYRPNEREEEGSDQEKVLGEQLAYRSIQEVTMSDHGTVFFQHRFPVDITIPMSRVSQLDDIYIQVESFDYRLPNQQCLQLTADLAITGIQDEETTVRVKEDIKADADETGASEKSAVVSNIDLSEQISFEMDVRKEDDAEFGVDEQEEELLQEDSDSQEQIPQIEMKGREEEKEESDISVDGGQDAIVSFAQTLSSDDTGSNDENKAVSREDEAEDNEEEMTVMDETENETEEIEASDDGDQNDRKEYRNENALYLTKMLTKEEEKFSKLKMRIIQPGDSLHSIAERYEVSPSHLVRVNRLEQEEIEEGQILYIPVSTGN